VSAPVRKIMAEALVGAMMLRPVIFAVRQAETASEIDNIINDAIDRDWLLPDQLPLLLEGIEA